jgi:O-antigen ligase
MRGGRGAQGDSSNPDGAPAADVLFVLSGILIVAACILGGASQDNPLRLASVELCALPVAALSLRRVASGDLDARRGRLLAFPLAMLVLILAVPLLQLAPMPPALWAPLPGQTPRLEALGLAHVPAPWLPITLSPRETGRAALALAPPAATLLGVAWLTPRQTRRLGGLWIGVAMLGVALGAAQIAAPAGGAAYLYRTANLGSLVGLFANRNHEAGFLLSLTPLAAALSIPPTAPGARWAKAPGIAPRFGLLAAFMLITVIALGVIRSRAGLILATPAVLLALAVLWRGARGRPAWLAVSGVAAAALVAVVAILLFAAAPILDRFGPHAPREFRYEAWPYVMAASKAVPPLGAGLGSFDRLFEAVEPLPFVAPTYFNHAHNDFLELWLETGPVGAGILAVFIVWLAWTTRNAWRSGSDLARAASAAIVLLMAQSWVDYPLRTETLAVLFAFCCGVLAIEREARR